ncbi:MAG: two-component system, OmpR family, sensor kinase [Thermomicrobiales bacterium]|nr:two-component system, OmpR family, sensor kinase [Thermomicrobiales bacterium]
MELRRRPIYRSIRFRLTAWYACLIITLVLALGIGLSTLIERELRQDVDQRLLRTAQDIKDQAVPTMTTRGPAFAFPPPDLFSFPSQLIQAVDASGTIEFSSENLGNRRLPASPIVADERNPVYTTGELDGVTIRSVHYPLVLKETGQLIGAVNVGEPLLQIDQTMGHVRRIFLFAGLLGLGAAAVGSWLLAGRALRPVDRITATASAIAAGAGASQSLATRLEVPNTGDELARLASTFNRMLDRLEEAFALQRRFIADASHELRTPLTAIRGNIDVLVRQASQNGIEGQDLSDALDDLRRESARMSRLIEDLLTLVRTEAPPDDTARRRPIRLDEVVEDAMRTAAALLSGQRLTSVGVAPVMIIADRDRMTELMLILLDNAIRHTPPQGEIFVSVEAAGSMARIMVRDAGEGIAPEDIPHVFERFYRAGRARDRATGGTGLGLAIAQSIARAHEGGISVVSTPGDGAAFTVTLPLAGHHVSERRIPVSHGL